MRVRFLGLFILSSLAAMSADERPLFIGMMTIGKEQRIVLTSQGSGKSSGWIGIGSTFEGYQITDYDPKTESIGLERESKRTRAHLVADAPVNASPGGGTSAALADAERLLQAMNFDGSLRKWALQLVRSNEALFFKEFDRRLDEAGLVPERVGAFHKLALEEVQRIATAPEVLAAAGEAYKKAYSKEELQSLMEFFSSPIGKLSTDKGPEIQEAISAVLVPRMRSTQSRLNELLSEFLVQEGAPSSSSK